MPVACCSSQRLNWKERYMALRRLAIALQHAERRGNEGGLADMREFRLHTYARLHPDAQKEELTMIADDAAISRPPGVLDGGTFESTLEV